METNKKRLIELALRGLELEKEKLDSEIASLRRLLRIGPQAKPEAVKVKKSRRAVNISPEESKRRSERMKSYWDNWRKQKAAQDKAKKKAR
jgi:hypothetical protein